MAAWPSVVDRLLAVLPTLPGWAGVAVYDGPPVTDVPMEYVTVGFVFGEPTAGDYEQIPDPGRPLNRETGTVRSQIVMWTGDVDLPRMRRRAFELADAWRDYLIANRNLGAFPPDFAASLSVDVVPAQTTAGSEQRLNVTLTYEGVV